MRTIFFMTALWLFATGSLRAQSGSVSSLRFLGEYEIPYNHDVKGSIVGGLSGIDYDAKRDVFYAISDDRGAHGDIRFYTLKIRISDEGIREVRFNDVTTLLSPKNELYPRNATRGKPDPEGMRFHPKEDRLYWISEGERAISPGNNNLTDPFIHIADRDGKFEGSFSLPENARVRAEPKGPRQNSTFEGLAFDDNLQNVFVAMEEPLIEDGPRADTVENGATTRIYKFDLATRKNIAQYAYRLEKVAHVPVPKDKFRINGVSEILHIGDNRLLTVERSFSIGRLPCTVKVFLSDLSGATNVRDIRSLKDRDDVQPTKKKLLIDFDDLGIYIDNVEGVSFGPRLPNGNRTLIFVTDNNFNWFEKTQLLLFEILP